MFEKLEPRRHFTVDVIGDQFVIDLEEQEDNTILISQQNNAVYVTIDGVKQQPRDSGHFHAIVVHGGPGKDNIFINSTVMVGCNVYGDGGNDTIECLANLNCTLDGGPGIDEVSFEHAFNKCYISANNVADDGISATAGTFDIHSNFEIFRGSEHNDVINASLIPNATVYGGTGNDTITGGQSGDVFGGDSDDLFLATDSLGSNSFFGGGGKDTVSYTGRSANLSLTLDATKNDGAPGENDYINGDVEGLIGGKGNDTLIGNQGDNFLNGFAGNDSLIGYAGDDSLSGFSGKDTLNGGLGADNLDGGSGSADLVTYVDRIKDVTVDLSGNQKSGELNEGDEIFNCEKAVTGSGDDTFVGNDSDNLFSGLGGNDRFNDSKGNDTYWGGAGNDIVSYLSRNVAGVTVSLDGVANDGASGEKDNVFSDVEAV